MDRTIEQDDRFIEESFESLTDKELNALAEELDRKQWARMARQAYEASTDYLEKNIYPRWQTSLSHFNNEHAPDSKYRKEQYKARSKNFRPKTRSTVNAHVAKMAVAAFSSSDLLSCQPGNQNDPVQAASAAIGKALVQYRLEHSIPWFLTLLGAYQDTHTLGVCISHQYWDIGRKTTKTLKPAMDEAGNPILDEEGNMLGEEVIEEATLYDRPAIDLVNPERIRFSPYCDWRDPINSSPYLIHEVPMTVEEVKAKMDKGDWAPMEKAQIIAHGAERDRHNGAVNQSRQGQGATSNMDAHSGDRFELVYPRRFIMRKDGEDYEFWMLGDQEFLTNPVPLAEVSFITERTGMRPYALGISQIESHQPIPASTAEQIATMQQAINDVANLRDDNVKLVLNKRYFVRRGAQVDIRSMLRNTPGGVVMTNDPDNDIKVISTPDVTSSAYMEQDRLAVETDELAGNFSQSSVQSNRALNETVGGMGMMQSGANDVQELCIRTFIETWVEPVLNQLLILEHGYETDEVVLGVAGNKAELFKKYGIDRVYDALLDQEVTITVNIGMNAVNPFQKIQRLQAGLNAVMGLPGMAAKIKADEVGKEVFGQLGYQDGSRFIMSDEEVQQAQQGQQQPQDPAIMVAQIRAEIEKQKMQMDGQLRQLEIEKMYEARMADIAARENVSMQQLQQRLGLEEFKIKTNRDIAALRETNRTNELNFKRETGMPGI